MLGVTEGVDGINKYCRKEIILPDNIDNAGEYPAASACGELVGHRSSNPCTVCFFGRRKRTSNGEFVYSSESHKNTYYSHFLMNRWIAYGRREAWVCS